MGLNELANAPGTQPVRPKPEVASEIRTLTLKIAFDNEWTEETSAWITDLFDGMADDWTAGHDNPDRDLLLHDALDRGRDGYPIAGERVLELGSGTSLGTRELARRFDDVVALDRSHGMLENAPPEYGPRVLGDSAALPIQSSSIDVLVLVNMFLFPSEADRVLAPSGSIVWINTFGENTPIHLTAEEVHDAMPGDWKVTHSRAGTGTWAVARRPLPPTEI